MLILCSLVLPTRWGRPGLLKEQRLLSGFRNIANQLEKSLDQSFLSTKIGHESRGTNGLGIIISMHYLLSVKRFFTMIQVFLLFKVKEISSRKVSFNVGKINERNLNTVQQCFWNFRGILLKNVFTTIIFLKKLFFLVKKIQFSSHKLFEIQIL